MLISILRITFIQLVMGNQFGKEKKPKDLNDLLQTTRFTEEEIMAWYKNFLKVDPINFYP